MTMMSRLTRRQFLRLGAAGGLIAAGGGVLSACAPRPLATTPTAASPAQAKQTPARIGTFTPDLEINLRAMQDVVQILPGSKTNVWRYSAHVTEGDVDSVIALDDNFLGPIIKVRTGQKLRVRLIDELPNGEPTIVHWHGLILPEDMDGHPRYQATPNQPYVYEFEVKNRAGTYWFHPHTHERTAQQVINGLAGLFLVTDEEEQSLDLPAGEADLPIIIQDRTFDANNQIIYDAPNMGNMMSNTSGGMMGGSGMSGMMGSMMGGMMSGGDASGNHGGMMTDMQMQGMQGMMSSVMGFLGERILVNGKPDFVLPVATRAYRLRLLNGSNSRIYKLAWSDGSPFTVIATDGGLLAEPVTRNYLTLAPGERVDVWADFSSLTVGEQITLESLPFDSGETMMGVNGMNGMSMTSNAPPLGAAMRIMTVRVDKTSDVRLTLPAELATLNKLTTSQAVNAETPRQFQLTLNGMQWLINGRKFEVTGIAEDERMKLHTTEVWEFVNEKNPGQMMDENGMPHPFHIHGVQVNVLSRVVLPELRPLWDGVRDGYIDDGWKDTFLLMPGERVKVLLRPTNTGQFVFHCHNLEHEGQGLMRNYEVVA